MSFKSSRGKAIRIEGEKSAVFSQARGRIALIVAFFLLSYMFLAARSFDLAVIQSGDYKGPFDISQDERVKNNTGPEKKTAALPRGKVLDRNGALLATTLPMASLYVDPHLVNDPENLAKDLMRILPDQSGVQILKKLTAKGRFVWLERNISPDQQKKILALGEPALAFEKGRARFYPHGSLASHLVGYTNVDQDGLAGIERYYQDDLADQQDITLSLDIRLQHLLHREVRRAIDEFTAKAGTGIILDVETGEVLAGVSLPDFNPHDAGNAGRNNVFNRLTLGVYELGSIFKIFSTAALLETQNVGMDFTFDATEPIRAGRFTINDYHAEDRVLTVPEVFMYSSNIGSAMMGQMVGTGGLKNFYRSLGLLDPVDFEIREIGKPLVPNPWGEVSTLTASYGHGLAVTPLQLSSAVASVVNGGFYVRPTLIKQNPDFAAISPEKNIKTRIISPQTSQKMRELLRLVVSEGTGKNADVQGFQVGGKTGTAEKASARGGYDRKKLISSFVGTFPSSNPKYVVMVMVDEPVGNKKSFGYATAGWVAAPPVARVISGMASILGIPAVENVEKDHENAFGAGLKHYITAKEKR